MGDTLLNIDWSKPRAEQTEEALLAIDKLSEYQYEEAIPALMRWIDYEVPYAPFSRFPDRILFTHPYAMKLVGYREAATPSIFRFLARNRSDVFPDHHIELLAYVLFKIYGPTEADEAALRALLERAKQRAEAMQQETRNFDRISSELNTLYER